MNPLRPPAWGLAVVLALAGCAPAPPTGSREEAEVREAFARLQDALEEKDGELVAHTERFLDRLGRPIDVCVSGGKLYVLEYCRQTETAGPGSEGWGTGGRVLEAAGK